MIKFYYLIFSKFTQLKENTECVAHESTNQKENTNKWTNERKKKTHIHPLVTKNQQKKKKITKILHETF